MLRMIPLILILVFSGCVKGEGGQQSPPTPLEVKILAMAAMTVAINVEKMNEGTLRAVETALMVTRDQVLLMLDKDPTNVETSIGVAIPGLDPLYQDLISDIMQIALLRARPYLDQQHPDVQLAKEYFEATVDGALAAINRARTRIASG